MENDREYNCITELSEIERIKIVSLLENFDEIAITKRKRYTST
jgi:hypothetical protein